MVCKWLIAEKKGWQQKLYCYFLRKCKDEMSLKTKNEDAPGGKKTRRNKENERDSSKYGGW